MFFVLVVVFIAKEVIAEVVINYTYDATDILSVRRMATKAVKNGGKGLVTKKANDVVQISTTCSFSGDTSVLTDSGL